MSAKDFEVGMRVYDSTGATAPARKGKVIGHSMIDPIMVAVEWDDGELDKCPYSYLELYDESLESDFEKVKDNVKRAAELMGEANDIASKHHTSVRRLSYEHEFGDELEEIVEELRETMEDMGWSSSNCY
jgi:hypothetical protein